MSKFWVPRFAILQQRGGPNQYNLMIQKRFQKVHASETRTRKPKEVDYIVSKLITPQHFLEYVTPNFFDFVMHNHVARW
jgi:hypothetical protein